MSWNKAADCLRTSPISFLNGGELVQQHVRLPVRKVIFGRHRLSQSHSPRRRGASLANRSPSPGRLSQTLAERLGKRGLDRFPKVEGPSQALAFVSSCRCHHARLRYVPSSAGTGPPPQRYIHGVLALLSRKQARGPASWVHIASAHVDGNAICRTSDLFAKGTWDQLDIFSEPLIFTISIAVTLSALGALISSLFSRRESIRQREFNEMLTSLLRRELEEKHSISRRSDHLVRFPPANAGKRTVNNDAEANSPYLNLQGFIQELSHNLNTPLSQIEAAALSISTSLPSVVEVGSAAEPLSGTLESNFRSLRRIESGINVIKLYLRAYGTVSESGEESSGGVLLNSAVNEIVEIYAPGRLFETHLPEQVGPNNTNIIVAALIPLIQNAAEETKPQDRISITCTMTDSQTTITIENPTTAKDLGDDIYDLGVSRKGAQRGIGLASSQAIIGTIGGTISHRLSHGTVAFNVNIPRGEK